MKKEKTNENAKTIGTVTHTHTHKHDLEEEKIKKLKIVVCVSLLISFTAIVMLISTVVNTRKSLERIIYNAKIEGEKALISSGLAVYTKDIEENNVGASIDCALSSKDLPENTTSTPQPEGTIVQNKKNWNIETVTAVSVGNGDTVPVPIGFYYVGGNLNTGVIISDDEADKYDGTTDKTTWEYTTSLKGNQFVWIPCKEEQYVKSEVWNGIKQKPSGTTSTEGTLCNSGWDKTTYTSELPQIRKYEGFYVGRYEAGLAKTITEFTSTQKHTTSNQVYNKEGIPQSKAGVVPWMFIDWNMSQKNSKNMYNTESVSSGLITGTQWDVMLKRIVEKTNLTEADLINSRNWGNYMDNSIEYKGRMARAYISSSTWHIEAFGGEKQAKTKSYSSNNSELLTTGASKQAEKYHIYDVSGNLWEWTEEISLYKEGNANETNWQYLNCRGSGFLSNERSTVYRGYGWDGYTFVDTGFRVVLYIK